MLIDRIQPRDQNTTVPSADAPETVYKLLGERLAHLRAERAVTQEDLGMFSGLTRASIANIEKGRQRVFLHQLYNFASFLNVALQDLLPEPNKVQTSGLMPEAEAAYLRKLKRLFTEPNTHRNRKRA